VQLGALLFCFFLPGLEQLLPLLWLLPL